MLTLALRDRFTEDVVTSACDSSVAVSLLLGSEAAC